MIDIHSHILPNMDDGPSSWEVSLKICQQACEDGIKTIVATLHTLNGIYDNYPKAVIEASKIIGQESTLDLVQTNPQKIIMNQV